MICASCPVCWRRWEFADETGGQSEICKNCGHQIPIPIAGQQRPLSADTIAADFTAQLQQEPTVATCSPSSESENQHTLRITPVLLPPSVSTEFPEPRSLFNGHSDSQPFPEWAIDKANASWLIGLSVPEIEKRLVDRGLAPEVAAAVVTAALEAKVREKVERVRMEERSEFLHRILSVLAVGACLVMTYFTGANWMRTSWVLLVALASIWFPEVMSRSSASEWTWYTRWIGWLAVLLMFCYRVWLLTLLPHQ